MILPNWNAPKNVKAFASTRQGGYSTGPYQGLNLGMHVDDDPEVVQHNRQLIAQQLSMPGAPVWLNQTHSTNVVTLLEPTSQVIDADGSFTRQKNVICCVMTADCLPVLLCDTQGSQVAAVHAGWRGLAGGILEQAVAKFSGDVLAWIGPAIGPAAFEVGAEVLEAFCSFDQSAQQAFVPRQVPGKWLADMNLLATQRLNRVGVKSVFASQLCTFENADDFYSYRRDGVTGRQASFIWLE